MNQNLKLLKKFDSNKVSFIHFFSQIFAFKETTGMPFLRFLWFKFTDKIEFSKADFPPILKLLIGVFVPKLDALWFLLTFSNQQKFFLINISLRIKLSKIALNCQLRCLYTLRCCKKIDFSMRSFQWILIFYKLFSFKVWCNLKFFSQILTFVKQVNSKSDTL